jgi:antitoxin ParD1/3/4
MDVSLGTEWERFVAERVESGRYRTVGDVLRDGLRLLERRDKALERVSFSSMEELEGKLQVGLDQLESGQVVPGEVAVKRIRERAAARRGANG